jgi:acyl-coenzyme A synthetase/AMP-(fatty) acid ligase
MRFASICAYLGFILADSLLNVLMLGGEYSLLAGSNGGTGGLIADGGALGSAFIEAGVQPGERVVLVLPPGRELLVGVLGAWWAGASVVLLHPGLPSSIQAEIARVALARFQVGPTGLGLPPRTQRLHPRVQRGVEEEAAVFFTSGSSGRPLGVRHTHHNLWRCAVDIGHYLKLRPGMRLGAVLPWAFHYGFSQWSSALCAGAQVVIPESTLPGELLAFCEGIDGLALVPPLWETVCAAAEAEGRQFPRMRLICSAGGVLPASLRARMQAVFPQAALHLLYGSTECLRSLHQPAEGLAPDAEAPLGRPVPGVMVGNIVEEGGVLRAARVGEVGELVHAGALMGLGYLGETTLTEARFRPCGPLQTERAWFSGDLVRQDAAGGFWYVGRVDFQIKTGGFRLAPEEVESALLAHPAVAAAVVVGLPDAQLGQRVACALRWRNVGLPWSELLRFLRGRLPSWALPRAMSVWTEPFPRLHNGKVDRRAVAAHLDTRAPSG